MKPDPYEQLNATRRQRDKYRNAYDDMRRHALLGWGVACIGWALAIAVIWGVL